jgi:hypothetical protein
VTVVLNWTALKALRDRKDTLALTTAEGTPLALQVFPKNGSKVKFVASNAFASV